VDSRRGKVTGVTLGSKGSRDDRSLAEDLGKVLRGGRIPASLRVDPTGLSEFTREVLGRCAGIRPGQVMTYTELARSAGRPKAARAVGQVMAKNPFPILIPCHRVVGAGYRLIGYGGGIAMKERLLAAEGWKFEGRGHARRLKPKVRRQGSEARSRRQERGTGKRSGRGD
jgi:methylated-DNA-[protein]-cysteine S-methyltransferase